MLQEEVIVSSFIPPPLWTGKCLTCIALLGVNNTYSVLSSVLPFQILRLLHLLQKIFTFRRLLERLGSPYSPSTLQWVPTIQEDKVDDFSQPASLAIIVCSWEPPESSTMYDICNQTVLAAFYSEKLENWTFWGLLIQNNKIGYYLWYHAAGLKPWATRRSRSSVNRGEARYQLDCSNVFASERKDTAKKAAKSSGQIKKKTPYSMTWNEIQTESLNNVYYKIPE